VVDSLHRPRYITCQILATVLSHPNTCSTRLRLYRLIAQLAIASFERQSGTAIVFRPSAASYCSRDTMPRSRCVLVFSAPTLIHAPANREASEGSLGRAPFGGAVALCDLCVRYEAMPLIARARCARPFLHNRVWNNNTNSSVHQVDGQSMNCSLI